MSADSPSPALELRGIEKRFGSVRANRGVSLTVAAGSIHGLVGENGAGKSTLMNLVYGLHRVDAGEMWIEGRPLAPRAPHEAIAAGVGMVHQHFMLVDDFTVLDNVLLGAEGGWSLRRGRGAARQELSRLAQGYGLEVPLEERVGDLAVGVQQRVEILKALYRGARLLILDEPTAVLTPREADALFGLLRRLRDEGRSVILVTHKLREVMAVTDAVTVLRQGAVVGNFATRQTSVEELATCMVGRPVALRSERVAREPGAVVLEARGLEAVDARGVRRLKGVDLKLHAGEVVGVAGVAGNGQSELLEILSGMRAPSAGWVRVRDAAGLTAANARSRRVAHVPEDRLRHGVVPSFSAADNVMLGYQVQSEYGRWLLDRTAIDAACARLMREHDVRPPRPDLALGAFSGGNQQKLVLARELGADPEVLLVGQPTRGVDVGAIEHIHRRLLALRDAGKAILLVSVELDEILALSDRVIVMVDGLIVGDLAREDANEERLGLLLAGVRQGGAA
jgi:simple sugar transport system ATP-binding protein